MTAPGLRAYVYASGAWQELPVVTGSTPVVTGRVEERTVCNFAVKMDDATGDAWLRQGSLVEVRESDGTTVVFGGVLESPTRQRVAYSSLSEWTLRAVDWHYLADKRTVAETYVSTQAGTIVADLVTKYLAAEGVTLGTVETGPVVTQTRLNYVPCSQALDTIAERSGFTWYIDESRALHFHTRSAAPAAPWSPTLADLVGGKLTVKRQNSRYRNREIVKGGRGLTDEQTESHKADGEQVAFPVGFPIAKVPTVTLDGVAQTVGIKGLDSAKDVYWNKGDAVVTFEVAPLANQVVQVVYTGEFAVVGVASDPDEQDRLQQLQGGTGIVDASDDMEPTSDPDGPLQVASQLLRRWGTVAVRIEFRTRRAGLKPGQVAWVTIPEFSIDNAEMLVESVRISTEGRGAVVYDVTMVQGPVQGSWTKLFQNIAKVGRAGVESVLVGEDEIVAVLAGPYNETWTWTETSDAYPFACPLPGATTHPTTTLYPC